MKIFTEPTDTVSPAEAHFGAQIAARLEEGSLDLPRSIAERLRAGRMQALAKRRVTELQLAPALAGAQNAAETMGAHPPSFWTRASALLPFLALVLGLVTIAALQDQERAYELAEVDAELLIADLPPTAYTDPGFLQYLKKAAQE
jgi:hypothetical protein